MPTVIDALLVTLGLDPKDFTKGKKEVDQGLKETREGAKKTGADIEDVGKNSAIAMKKLKNEVISLGAALLGASGVKEFANKIISSDAALGRMARRVGENAGEIAVWQRLAERAGGTAGGMASAIQMISTELGNMHRFGRNNIQPFLYELQVDVAKFNDVATPMGEKIMLLADAAKRFGNPVRAGQILASMGFDDGTINVIMKGTEELAKLRAEQEKIGHATAENAKQAERLEASWNAMAQSAMSLGRGLLYFVTPGLEKVAGLMSDLSSGKLGGALYEFLHPGESLPGGKNEEADYDASLGSAKFRPSSGKRGIGAGANYSNEGRNSRPGSGLPRGIRNNNPGNLNFVGQAGAELEGGVGANARFARFSSMADGVAALASQLQVYQARGVDTIKAIIEKYAPPSENNTGAYVMSVSKALGIGAEQRLDLKNVAVLREMISAISTVENGPGRLGIDQINAGLSLYAGRYAGSGASNSTDVKINELKVYTQATDAPGIARDMQPALQLATQANSGMD